jgi:hypothetical protein
MRAGMGIGIEAGSSSWVFDTDADPDADADAWGEGGWAGFSSVGMVSGCCGWLCPLGIGIAIGIGIELGSFALGSRC